MRRAALGISDREWRTQHRNRVAHLERLLRTHIQDHLTVRKIRDLPAMNQGRFLVQIGRELTDSTLQSPFNGGLLQTRGYADPVRRS